MIPRSRAIGEVTFTFVRPPARRISLNALLLSAADDTVVVAHEASPSRPLRYRDETVVDRGYWAVWFLFKGRPFDVGRFYRPDGTWTGYYVDVLEPVHWEGSDPTTLRPIVDLFLDLWIAPDGSHAVVDEDEFDAAVRQGHLAPSQATHAQAVLHELIEATQRGVFPPEMVKAFRVE